MELREELQLPADHRLVHRKHSTAGARGNIDVDVYDVVDASGAIVMPNIAPDLVPRSGRQPGESM